LVAKWFSLARAEYNGCAVYFVLFNRATRREPTVVNALHITMIRRIFAICQDTAAIVLDAGKRCANTLAHLKHASLKHRPWLAAFTSGRDPLGGWADALRPIAERLMRASRMRLSERYSSASAARQTRQVAAARVARATVVR
jgi:hypothetical protein